MPEEKKNNLGQISDEALDALLAQWAEAEIAPPAGFHEKTMERLRSLETTEKKQNGKLISLFAGRKKWMSAAAAAVLVLCCIPVVQGQLGGTGDQPVIDTLPGQTTVVEQKAAEEAAETYHCDFTGVRTYGKAAPGTILVCHALQKLFRLHSDKRSAGS